MSTSGVPRPSPLSKITAKKAVAAAGDTPDDAETVEETPTDKAPVRPAATGAAAQAGAKGRASAGKTSKAAPTERAAKVSDHESPAKKSPAAKTRVPARAAARPGAKAPAGRGPVKAGGGKGRRPTQPIKVYQGRNWGPIMLFTTVGVVALAIVGFAIYAVVSRPDPTKWKDRADSIPGIVDYRNQNPAWLNSRNHVQGVLQYQTNPPVGGNHNPNWQNCMGNVYTQPIAKEHAVHSLEHGAVWIAYQPNLPKDQVDKLASKVANVPYTLMAPYPGLDKPISLQAWGFQLKVDNADDSRIDDFITNLKQNASVEPGAVCSSGVTDQGITTPLNLSTP